MSGSTPSELVSYRSNVLTSTSKKEELVLKKLNSVKASVTTEKLKIKVLGFGVLAGLLAVILSFSLGGIGVVFGVIFIITCICSCVFLGSFYSEEYTPKKNQMSYWLRFKQRYAEELGEFLSLEEEMRIEISNSRLLSERESAKARMFIAQSNAESQQKLAELKARQVFLLETTVGKEPD